jgi:acyl carrier protein
MDEFLGHLKDVLDLEQVDEEQVLEDLPEWDSLTALSVIAMIDAEYLANFASSDLKGGLTARSLFGLIQDRRSH